MYLKSLVLKGFKSFADRSVLTLEPGITVIVGPNGSGKSNISDAILWVLGEQSVKQLRGQSMEDVIFSGSSARQAVGVAEVDLVLDNSDGTLPLDFQEVCITRRMYRNSESEYLINGSPCLLRDVLDILHDTGLGRDTQSIISQGSLGSVLQSKPEDRRALIEEAAGTLKHKKRKERANRKLVAMDAHLTRVTDLLAEMDRQLRPLERLASKARQYKELSAELKDLHLQLAVDDLRSLEAIWRDIEKRDKELAAEVELARYRYAEKERELNRLQRMLEEKGLFVGDLAEQRRRCQSVLERLDANMLLLEEKGRNMINRTSDLRGKIYRAQSRLEIARKELEDHRSERETCTATLRTRSKELAELGRQSEAIRKARASADQEFSRQSADLRGKQRAVEDCRVKMEKARNALSSSDFEAEMLRKRLEQLEQQQSVTQGILSARRSRLETLEAELDKNRRESEQARFDIDKFVRLLEMKQANLNTARDTHAAIRASLKGLEEVDRAFENASPALTWLLAHERDFKASLRPISDLFRTSAQFETLVERLLGADIFGPMVDDSAVAARMAEQLLDQVGGNGEISLLPLAGSRSTVTKRPRVGMRLLDMLEYEPAYTAAAEALLGDIYIVDSIHDAVAANAVDHSGVRFATMEGVVVWPNGKITMGTQTNDIEGVLARRRKMDDLNEELLSATSALTDAELAVSDSETTLTMAQQEDFELSTTIAQLQGESDSLREEVGRLEQTITSGLGERSDIERQLADIAARNLASQPLIGEMEQRI
ncbi:MAG: AAA family ATPase, partial [Coriobacteriales bacterium]|nr:AAA family ATPase [Coriobacteriales bacterium]